MHILIQRFISLFRSGNPVPQKYQKVFFHFYMDMAWIGVASGTTMSFIGVYATRQGANPTQIGLLSAVPALVNLLFALPAASWISKRPMGRSVFWASVFTRIFYLFLIPLPVLFPPETQVWIIILITFLMTIPGTALVVGFNSFYAEVIPVEWRGHVFGIRNAVLAVSATVFTFLSGYILNTIPFPSGYQVVFLIGFVGAALSSVHLFIISRLAKIPESPSIYEQQKNHQYLQTRNRLSNEIQKFYRQSLNSLRLDVMKGPYAKTMLLLFSWHLAQFMTIPIVTPFIVNELHISDKTIALANGLFNMTTFFGSLQLSRVAARFGNKRITSGGVMLLSLFPILTAFGIAPFILANIIGGIGWSLVGGGLYNFLLEKVPSSERPPYMAWYALVSNAAILIGSLAGPWVGGVIGISAALIIFGFLRFLSGVAILRWG